MANKENILRLLKKIYKLLNSVNEGQWSRTFKYFITKCKYNDEFKSLISEILKIYAGMGSFSDLVLYCDGQLLFDENQQLDTLRNELYVIVVKTKESKNK